MQDEKQASTTSGYPMLVVLPVSIATGIASAVLLGGIRSQSFGITLCSVGGHLPCGVLYGRTQ
jgi:hypothetical protein